MSLSRIFPLISDLAISKITTHPTHHHTIRCPLTMLRPFYFSIDSKEESSIQTGD